MPYTKLEMGAKCNFAKWSRSCSCNVFTCTYNNGDCVEKLIIENESELTACRQRIAESTASRFRNKLENQWQQQRRQPEQEQQPNKVSRCVSTNPLVCRTIEILRNAYVSRVQWKCETQCDSQKYCVVVSATFSVTNFSYRLFPFVLFIYSVGFAMCATNEICVAVLSMLCDLLGVVVEQLTSDINSNYFRIVWPTLMCSEEEKKRDSVRNNKGSNFFGRYLIVWNCGNSVRANEAFSSVLPNWFAQHVLKKPCNRDSENIYARIWSLAHCIYLLNSI